MTLLAPGWLFIGAGASLALVALHLLAVGRPAPMLLPTARFVPARMARARRLARVPADLLLLATRVMTVLLAALAFAQPVRTPSRRTIARVVLANRSRAARDANALRDSVRAIATAGDVIIGFDTSVTRATLLTSDSVARDSAMMLALGTRANAPAAGSLSAALAAARRAVPMLRERADSIELVIVSALTTREVDAATLGMRATWPGRARIVRVAADSMDTSATNVRIVSRRVADDAIFAAGAHVVPNARVDVRVARDGIAASDLAWAKDSGGALVDWPVDGSPARWTTRARRDTAGAVIGMPIGGASVSAFVAPIERRATAPADGEIVARWSDGQPAAIERPLGAGCVREVGVSVPQIGDAALRPPFRALFAALTSRCRSAIVGIPLDDASAKRIAGAGPLLVARTLPATSATRDPLGRWLLAASIALLLIELPFRLLGQVRESVPGELDASPRVAQPREAA